MKRILSYRLLPMPCLFFWLCCSLATTLLLFAAVATRYAACFPDYLLLCRYIAAAKENAPALLAVGVIGSTLSDLALRHYLSIDD